MAENIVYMVLVGAGGLIAITASTYFMAYMVDRLCPSRYPTDRVFSPVSNNAGLWGLGLEERADILNRLFADKKLISKYNAAEMKKIAKEPVEIEMSDLKKSSRSSDGGNETITENESETMGPESDIERAGAMDEVAVTDESVLEADDVQQTTLCSICLVDFADGAKVMTGMHCSHLYHVPCIMEWMGKGHDYCPFCRKLMMTPEAMRNSAIQVLGEARVRELSIPHTTTNQRETQPASNQSAAAQREQDIEA